MGISDVCHVHFCGLFPMSALPLGPPNVITIFLHTTFDIFTLYLYILVAPY